VDSKIDCTKASLWEQQETIWKSITTETMEKYSKRTAFKILQFLFSMSE